MRRRGFLGALAALVSAPAAVLAAPSAPRYSYREESVTVLVGPSDRCVEDRAARVRAATDAMRELKRDMERAILHNAAPFRKHPANVASDWIA